MRGGVGGRGGSELEEGAMRGRAEERVARGGVSRGGAEEGVGREGSGRGRGIGGSCGEERGIEGRGWKKGPRRT